MDNVMNYSIIKNLIEKDRGIINLRKIKDATNRYHRSFTLTLDDIQKSVNNFDRTFGVVSDGTRRSIDDGNSYFRIVTDITIPNTYNKGFFTNLKELAMKEIPVFFIYLNGVKIPDNRILVYRSISNTDVFIPYDLIDLNNEIDVIIETVYLSDFQYIMGSFTNLNTSVITIDLDSIEAINLPTDLVFEADNFLVYINGVLAANKAVESINYDKSNKTLKLNLDINMAQTIKSLEVYYNKFIKYRKQEVFSEPTTQFQISFDLSKYQDPIRGSIPKKALKYFINGKKYDTLKVTQVGRCMYIATPSSNELISSYDISVIDIGLIDDSKISVMGSDYFLQKMIGGDRINNYLNTNYSDSIFDEHNLDILKVMKGDSEEIYNDNKNATYLQTFLKSGNDFKNQFKRIVDRNPNIVKNYLNAFARPTSYYFVTKNESSSIFNLPLVSKINPETHNVFIDLFINRRYVSSENYEIGDDVIKIDSSKFKDGLNVVEFSENVIEQEKSSINYEIFQLQDLELIPNSNIVARLRLNKKDYPIYFNLDNISVLEKVENDSRYIYSDMGIKIGYRGISDYLEKTETDDEIIINFTSVPENDIVIIFTDFYYTHNGIFRYLENDKTGDVSSMNLDQLIPLNDGSVLNPIPIIKKGVPNLYVNGELFVYGKDYNYMTPEENGKLATSCVMLIRQIKEGDEYSIHFTKYDDDVVLSKIDCPLVSKYGLMYFGNMGFPFDPSYIDIFIDSEKVFLHDIDILSDKLIRIKNLPVPFTDVIVKTRFDCMVRSLEEYYSLYHENDFEQLIKKLFNKVDYTKDELLMDSIYDPDDIYESFEPDVGHTNPTEKLPNEVKPDDDIIRVDIVKTMYIQWLISDDARSIIKTGDNIDSSVLGFFELYNITGDDDNDKSDIYVDSSKLEFTFNGSDDIVFNCNKSYLKVGEKFKMITDSLMKNHEKNEVHLNNLYKEYLKDDISNFIIPNDYPKFEKVKRGKYNMFNGLTSDITTFNNRDHISDSYSMDPMFDYEKINIEDYKKI